MWCPSCKADVAAEVAADNRRVHCATCGTEISAPSTFGGIGKTREARELLERWASERKPESPAVARSQPAGQRSAATANRGPTAGISLEAEIPVAQAADGRSTPPCASATQEAARQAASESLRSEGHRLHAVAGSSVPAMHIHHAESRGKQRAPRVDAPRADSQHEFAPPPHFEIRASLFDSETRRTNWTSVLGHLLAYAGVGLLTVGCTLVLWSHFGGPETNGPTGWLTVTAGQMLLFLGVVTLVSGGLEQTNEDFRTRMERLGERIIRIEQMTRAQSMRGPYVPAEYFSQSAPPPTVDEMAQSARDTRQLA